MKKYILPFTLASVILVLFTSQTSKPEKELTVSLPLNEWEYILQTIEDSKYHENVKRSQALLLPQLRKQIVIDSTNKK